MHNKCMMSQVIVRPPAGGRAALHIDPVQAPGVRQTDGRPLQLGSQDLIRIAGYAAEHGFKVTGFIVADAFLTPLAADEQREVSDSMLQILGTYGTRELNAAMDDDFNGLYVTGVELISRRGGLRIVVRRRGYVETSVVEEAEQLLNSAWRELRLS